MIRKNLILICFSLLMASFTPVITAQVPEFICINGDFRLLNLHYTNSGGENGVTTFEYDKDGRLYKGVWHLLDGKRFSINYYSNDDKGRLIKKYREYSDRITSTQVFTHDDSSYTILETFDQSDDTKGTVTHFYDSTGKLLKSECRGSNGWFFGDIIHDYDSSNRVRVAKIVKDGENIGKITYEYDEHNNLNKERWEFQKGFWQEFIYEYENFRTVKKGPYTSSNAFINTGNGYRISSENYDYSRKSGGPSYYEYDPTGKLVTKTFIRSDGLKTFTDYFYNASNQLIKSVRKFADGKGAIFEYKYDDRGKLKERSFKRTDGVSGKDLYYYDNSGKLIKAEWDNFDTWLTGTLEFVTGDKGLPLKADFKGKNNFDAKITFLWDKNYNLVKIHWGFSFGGYQTYTFEYTEEK